MERRRPSVVKYLFTMIFYQPGMNWAKTSRGAMQVVLSGLRLLAAVIAGVFALPAMAQSVTTVVNTTDAAVNGTTTCTAPLIRQFVVTGSFVLADVDIGVLVTHTWRGDLQMTLVGPDGTRVQLTNGDTANISGDNFNVRLDDSAAQLVNTDSATGTHSATAPPFQNRFRPRNALSAFNGRNAQGTWRLEICDLFPGADDGNFRHAELYLTSVPSAFADLSLTKNLIGSPPGSGGTVSWRLTVINASNSTSSATGITVQDTLPAGFVFGSANGIGSFNSTTGVWTVGSLAPGRSAVITLTGTVSAAAGTTLTNTAEIVASSVFDPDSTPGNGANSEDDYAISSFVVSSGRAPGIAPVLSCPAGSSIFDWDSVLWTAGSTDNTYAFASFGNIRFQLNNDGAFLNSPAFGGQSPTVFNGLTGGFTRPENSLTLLADQTTLAGDVEIGMNLPTALTGIQFTIFDVDFFAGQFTDRVEVIGSLNGATVLPVLTNGNVNLVSGNVVIGDGLSADGEGLGNVVVTFNQPIDRILVRYGNHSNAPTNPGQQAIAIHDLIACNPVAALSVTKVSTLISDPVNLGTNPKAIPGAVVEYLITVANNGTAATDANSVVVLDNGPPDAKLCQIASAGGPVVYSDAGGTGLTYSFISLASSTDSLEFSNNNGAGWTYVPSADAQGCDGSVTSFRVRPGGGLGAGRSFNLRVRYIIE